MCQKYLVLKGPIFKVGSIVTLDEDDGTTMPLFKLVIGGCRYTNAANNTAVGGYTYWSHVEEFSGPIWLHRLKMFLGVRVS